MPLGMECLATGPARDDLCRGRSRDSCGESSRPEVILIGRDTRRAAVGRKVQPAVASHVDAAVDLAGRVVPLRHIQNRFTSTSVRNALVAASYSKTKRVPRRRAMVADRRIVLAGDGRAVAPDRPRISGIRLLGVIEKIDRRRGRRNRDTWRQRAGWFQKVGRTCR